MGFHNQYLHGTPNRDQSHKNYSKKKDFIHTNLTLQNWTAVSKTLCKKIKQTENIKNDGLNDIDSMGKHIYT